MVPLPFPLQIVEYAAARPRTFPRVLWRETTPQHFETPLGYWGGKYDGPWTCRPLPNLGIDSTGALYLNSSPAASVPDEGLRIMLRGGYHNRAARRVFGPAGIPVLDGWNETIMLWDMHRNNTEGLECSHYCTPSAVQIWIFYLYTGLRDTGL